MKESESLSLLRAEEGDTSCAVDYENLAHWKHDVNCAWWYRVSSFTYCAAGSPVVWKPEILARYVQHSCCRVAWPFRVMGICIMLNGVFSYMGDVVTFGRQSAWQRLDVTLAITNTVVQIMLVLAQCWGFFAMPIVPSSALGIGLLVALACKRRAVLAIAREDCGGYLLWHTAWHVMLPLGALIGQLMLVVIDDGGRADLFLCFWRAACLRNPHAVYDEDHNVFGGHELFEAPSPAAAGSAAAG
jgi:hypothetical protein